MDYHLRRDEEDGISGNHTSDSQLGKYDNYTVRWMRHILKEIRKHVTSRGFLTREEWMGVAF